MALPVSFWLDLAGRLVDRGHAKDRPAAERIVNEVASAYDQEQDRLIAKLAEDQERLRNRMTRLEERIVALEVEEARR